MGWTRIAATAGALVLVLIGLVGGAYYALDRYYYPDPPEAHYPAPRNAAEAQRDDLDYFEHFLTRDWSYTPRTRAQAQAVIDHARQHLPLTKAQFELAIAKAVAAADNGHTGVWPGSRANRFNRLPLRTYPFADGVYVVRALPQAYRVLGAQIIAIDGTPMAELRKALRIYRGGKASFRDVYSLAFFIESPALLHAAGYASAPDRETLTLRMPDGRETTTTLTALPGDPKGVKAWAREYLDPSPLPGEANRWKAALAGKANGMLLFAGARTPFVLQALPKQNAYYVRFNQNESDPKHDIGAFTDRALTVIKRAKPRTVVVDLRFNGGGDYTTTAHFMRTLPRILPKSTFYALMSPNTFSAGMSSAAFLKYAGGARTILVGAPPGDRLRYHSEGGKFCLPFSGICMSARTAIHDHSTTSCRPLNECFALDYFYPAAIKSFQPQISAPLTYAALSQGHDPALRAIFPDQGF